MNDPSWTDIIQTIAIIAALIFTAYEMRARTREQRFANYLTAIAGSVDLAKLMVEHRELHAVYEYSPTDWPVTEYQKLTPEQKSMVHYCDQTIALCETVWLAAREGWVSPDEWHYWKVWADQLNQSPAFRWTLQWVRTDYDPQFISEVQGLNPSPVRTSAPTA